MSVIPFLKAEIAAAVARGVRQFVWIGSRSVLREWFTHTPEGSQLELFAVGEDGASDLPDSFIQTDFGSETLANALQNSNFDHSAASLFLWLGGAGYRTVDLAIASLAFIAKLPQGSGVVFDYAAERTAHSLLGQTALDALASRIAGAGNSVKHLIQPQAVAVLLRSLGFQRIEDLSADTLTLGGAHIVSALV